MSTKNSTQTPPSEAVVFEHYDPTENVSVKLQANGAVAINRGGHVRTLRPAEWHRRMVALDDLLDRLGLSSPFDGGR